MRLQNIFKKIIEKTKRKLLYMECKIKYDGKPFSPAIQSQVKKIIYKYSPDIYFHDEKTSRSLADRWQGRVCKPNLRFIENAVPVVLSANEDFAPYMAVMLQSLMDNSNPLRKYHFIILGRDFSDETKKYILNQKYNFSHCEIDFINTESAFAEIPIIPRPGGPLSIDTFSRLFIPYWLDRYPKVIYCDSDMIAKADIAELYDLDMHDSCMGAVIAHSVNVHLQNRTYSFFLGWPLFLNVEDWTSYINAGVLVFNTKKFMEKISYHDCFKFAIYFTNRFKERCNDQDVLVSLVKSDCFSLPQEWNYVWRIFKDGKRLFRLAESNTKLFHFVSPVKPWKNIPEIASHPDVLAYRNYAKTVPLYRERNR